jgi:hypothetical protein
MEYGRVGHFIRVGGTKASSGPNARSIQITMIAGLGEAVLRDRHRIGFIRITSIG